MFAARSRRLVSIVLCAVSCASVSHAGDGAKPTLSGTWSATSLKESWSTTEWGEDCGPKPSSSGGAPGGTVTVTESGGELSFAGAGRAFTTAECWEQLPGLKRTGHSASSRGWSNKCSSPPGDPRRATISNATHATDDTIVFSETGVFEWGIKDSVCKASVSRSRSFKLVQRAGEAPAPPTAQPAAPTAAPEEPKAEGCDAPGPPARLEVRPSKKLLRPGEGFDLAVRVADAKGCRVGVLPEVRVRPGGELAPKIAVDRARVTAAADAPAGTATIEVSLAGKTVEVTVEVALPDAYDELLKVRGLNARGEDDSVAVAEIAAGLGGAATVADDTARSRKLTFLAIVGGVAGLFGLVGLVLWRRGRGRAEAPERITFVASPPNVALFETTSPKSLECPVCGRGYPPGAGFCSDDGTALVPSAAEPPPPPPSEPPPAAAPGEPPAPRTRKKAQKICPSCGEFFAAEAQFCGKDGTQLVPVN